MARDLVRILSVRGGRQYQLAALRTLVRQISEELGAVGQHGHVQIHPPCDLILEACLAAEQPERKTECRKRILLDQSKQGLEQYVRADQRTIEVDRQRHRIVNVRRIAVVDLWFSSHLSVLSSRTNEVVVYRLCRRSYAPWLTCFQASRTLSASRPQA